MGRVTIDTSSGIVYLYSTLIGVGVGMTFQIAYDVSMTKVEAGEEQRAIAYINVAQIGCAGIALSIAGCIYQNLGVHKLKEVLGDGFPQQVLRDALGGLKNQGVGEVMGLQDDMRRKALTAIVETMGCIYWLVVVAGCVCAISGLAMKWERVVLESKPEGNRRYSVNYEAIV